MINFHVFFCQEQRSPCKNETNDGIIPVEVKSAENIQSKRLKSYVNKFNPKYSVRISTKNFGFVNNIKSVPLYAVFCIKK